MRFGKGMGVIGIAFVVSVSTGFISAQGVPCSEAHVNYDSPTPFREQHLSISTDISGAFDEATKVVSDAGPNRWLVTVDPVYTKVPPWNTTIFVGDVGSDKPILKDEYQASSGDWLRVAGMEAPSPKKLQQGLKPGQFSAFSARLKSGPVTRLRF